MLVSALINDPKSYYYGLSLQSLPQTLFLLYVRLCWLTEKFSATKSCLLSSTAHNQTQSRSIIVCRVRGSIPGPSCPCVLEQDTEPQTASNGLHHQRCVWERPNERQKCVKQQLRRWLLDSGDIYIYTYTYIYIYSRFYCEFSVYLYLRVH